MSYGHVTKISFDHVLLSEPTTEANGNDPYCKREQPSDNRITQGLPNDMPTSHSTRHISADFVPTLNRAFKEGPYFEPQITWFK